jgi:hypothetical protein
MKDGVARSIPLFVIPAKAGIHGLTVRPWTPDQVGGDNIENSKKRIKKFVPRVLDLS